MGQEAVGDRSLRKVEVPVDGWPWEARECLSEFGWVFPYPGQPTPLVSYGIVCDLIPPPGEAGSTLVGWGTWPRGVYEIRPLR